MLLTLTSLDITAQLRVKNGMVVSASDLASDIGVKILKKGGNAVDAAAAVGFAQAVTYPSAGNLGGGGFMVIHLANGKNTSIDFREIAPLAAYESMFLDSLGNYDKVAAQEGWRSAGVPGTVAGLIYALEKYGTLSLSDVIQPAIDLAEKGFPLSYRLAASINVYNAIFASIETSKKIFTKNGDSLEEGDLFVQHDLANTLKCIRDGGAGEFYKGKIAEIFIDQSKKNNGILSKKDLESYSVIEREPIDFLYKGYQVISMPPPSSGGVCLASALNAFENAQFQISDWGSSNYLHYLIEIQKRIYAERSEHLGDPKFHNVPESYLTSKEFGNKLWFSISDTASSSLDINPSPIISNESTETTHYSILDKSGNAVSTTYTINGAYGNKIVVEGLGFLLNNEMDDFSAKPMNANQFGLVGGKANSIQPHKRMLSSMTPTIVLKEKKPVLIIGSPGGAAIISSVIQVLLNVVDFKMNIFDAINAPRFHHQWFPDEVVFEKYGLNSDVKENLIKRGHVFGSEAVLGRVEGIFFDQENNAIFGATDKRGFGKAAGY